MIKTSESSLTLTESSKPHSRPIVSYYFPKGVGEHHYGVIVFTQSLCMFRACAHLYYNA
jgi:hypothetical protein